MSQESTTKSQTSFSFNLVKDSDEILNDTYKKLYSRDIDFYAEENSELKQLFSKPTCVLVIGKPGSGKTSLAKKIAVEWNLELINLTHVITEHAEANTEIGATINDILARGEQIPPEMVIHLLKQKLQSPQANNLGYVLDDFPNLDDNFMSIAEQFEILKSLNPCPDYVIHIKIPDEDLLVRRKNQRVDSVTGWLYTHEFFYPRPVPAEEKEPEKSEEEEENIEENEEEEDGEIENPLEILQNTVVRPEDFVEYVFHKIEKYNNHILPLLENYIENFPLQNVLEVDGNKNVNDLLKNIYFWFENMGVCKGFSPIQLFNEDSEIPSIEDVDEIFRNLAGRSSLNSRFPWRRSRFGVYCPVSLAMGSLVKGSIENALVYMGKLYLLSDKEAMKEFYSNPRKYFMPSCIKIPCKFWITGSPCSAKTSICHLLAEHYGAEVISMKESIIDEKERQKQSSIEEKRTSITEKLMMSLHKTLITTFDNVLAKLILNNEENQKENELEEREEDEEKDIATEDPSKEEQTEEQTEEKEEKIAEEDTPEEVMLKELLGVEQFTNDLIGTQLPTIPDDFPYLQSEITTQLDKIKNVEISLDHELMLDMLMEKIHKSKEERILKNPSDNCEGKWIIDDFPLTEEIVNSMTQKGFAPDEIISLLNSPDSCDQESLKSQLEVCNKTWQRCYPLILGTLPVQPMAIPTVGRQIEEIKNEIIIHSERYFKFSSWIYTAREIEDEASEDEELDEEEAEQRNSSMRQYGELKNFCPVIFKDNFVLCPGNPEIPAKYRDKIYYFSSEDAREMFMINPEYYLPEEKSFNPPPLRLCILGTHGSGKSVLGRYLAEKHNIFFISFRDRLQEMIIGKTRRIVGEPYFEPPEETDEGSNYVLQDGKLIHKKTIFLTQLQSKFDSSELDWLKDNIPDLIEEYESEEGKLKEETITKPDFTEVEEAIVSYLENGTPMATEILETIISEWWNKEPFRSTGFVLEGFPHTLEDARFLLESKLFPDLFLVLNVDQPVTLKRQLHLRMASWRERDALLKSRIVAKREMNVLERELKMKQRRLILTNEKNLKELEEKEDQLSEKYEESVVEESLPEEEEEVDEIDQQLAEEFDEIEADEETENIEDAQERIENEYAEVYDNDVNSLANVLDVANEFLLPKIEIDANRREKIMFYLTDRAIAQLCHPRKIFERIYEINRTLARSLLDAGYKFYSHFKTWCPVEVFENNSIKQSNQFENSIPAIYRNNIYFLSSKDALEKFSSDPQKYVGTTSPKTIIPFKIGIFGPPKSGKSTLANKLCRHFGLIRVSVNEALNYVLKTQSFTELAGKIDQNLKTGDILSDSLACEAICILIMSAEAKINGFVLDGYPLTVEQHDLLESKGIRLGCVINLVVDRKRSMYRGLIDRFSVDRKDPIHDSALSLSLRLERWNDLSGDVYELYTRRYANLSSLNAQKSKWWVWKNAKSIITSKMKNIVRYSDRISKNLAAPLMDLSITPEEFGERLTDLREFCPVSLVDDEELVDCSECHNLHHAAEYRARYYKMSNFQNLQMFLHDPEKYITSARLPEDDFIPKKIDDPSLTFPDDYAFGGFCPVTFHRGEMRYEALTRGSPRICSKYCGQFFCFVSADLRNEFLRRPSKFASLKMPHKLPPERINVDYNNLPILGYLEQRFASIIIKALTYICEKKPKYPFLSSRRSALLLLSYYLKAHNTKSPDYLKAKYRSKLEDFDKCCELISYLGDNMNIRTFEPEYRPKGFDEKFHSFFQIKENNC